jgi:hypothetical protein
MIDEDFGWASLAKQIPMEIDIEGDFRGHFTNTTKRTLVNADPKCIDEYYLVAGSLTGQRLTKKECLILNAITFRMKMVLIITDVQSETVKRW